MRTLIAVLVLAGCTSAPARIATIEWVVAGNGEPLVLIDDAGRCVIVTNREDTTYAQLGAAVRTCITGERR